MPFSNAPSDVDDRRRADARRLVADVEHAVATGRLDDLLPSLRRVEGPDRTGAVSCVVDESGHFLDVHLAGDWRRHLDGGALGTAILEALRYARSKAGVVPLILRRHGVAHSAPAAPRYDHDDAPLPPADSPGYHDAVQARIRETARILDTAEARMATYRATSGEVLTSPHGIFRATIDRSGVQRLDVDRYSADTADIDVLLAEARAVLRTAEARRAGRD